MKKLLLLIFVISSHFCDAQNWQCLQGGVKHYFTNGNGYLRGIRIDSVRTVGSDVVYYPFRTMRGDYQSLTVDSNGGSWLGKKVIGRSDGTFLFDNIWQDTIVIKTNAHVGDSWIFYNDTTSIYYRAELTAIDTMTVLSSLDSIKKILVTARNSSGIVTSDPVDSFQIVLSKNNGFVNVFDLYTFPYHAPDTVYAAGYDYFLDYVTSYNWFGSVPHPNSTNSMFSLINLANPTRTQLYDWNVGDVFENSTFSSAITSWGYYPYGFNFDSITSKTVLTSGVQYSYTGWAATQHFPSGYYVIDPGMQYPYDVYGSGGVLTFNNNLLMDTTMMPEEKTQPCFQFYFPGDTSFCLKGNRYKSIELYAFYEGSEASPLWRTAPAPRRYVRACCDRPAG